jgi:hypothetical protein
MRSDRGRHQHSWLYRHYMGSRLWKARRWAWVRLGPARCERCRCRLTLHTRDVPHAPPGSRVATVHHRTYRHLGYESRGDVELLCWPCHERRQFERDVWLREKGLTA